MDRFRVYTYTKNCEYEKAWDDITLNSRGIVLDVDTGEVVAQPFRKFFNANERPDTQWDLLPWNSEYEVFEKLDGWLGTMYRHDGRFKIATRGSFISNGAVLATKMLQKHPISVSDDVTLVFEIISPQTRIVVDYGDAEELVLLAAFNRHTGVEYSFSTVKEWAQQFRFRTPKVYGDGIDECKRLLAESSGRIMEGYVVRFADGRRVKVKGEDYRRRAAIIKELTPLTLWRTMSSGRVDRSCCNSLESEYAARYERIACELERRWKVVLSEIEQSFEKLARITDRAKFAVAAEQVSHASVMFARLDRKQSSIERYVSKQIRPTGNEFGE
jgi:RNA ligase